MIVAKILSPAKINISLNVLRKLKSGYHQIESLITLIKLSDQIEIKPINSKLHKVFFYGKFSRNIKKNNTITRLLNILDKKNKLKEQKYFIKIKKNIPSEAGLGGGSINAGSILKFFLDKKIIKAKKKEIIDISNKVGSDVILGLQNRGSILVSKNNIYNSNKKIKLYLTIIKPNFGCSTKRIYKSVKNYSKEVLINSRFKNLKLEKLINLNNDLEKLALHKYPALQQIKENMEKVEKVKFVRMTGSGSCLISYFNSKKASLNAAKILKTKYKNYWCISSKTI